MTPLEILETCLYVDDLAVAEQFYTCVMQLELLGRQPGRHVFLRCGAGMLLLFDAGASGVESDVPPHGARGPGHLAFRIPEQEFEAWQDHLTSCQVATEKIVDWPQGGRSLYFRDPAGNSLELAPSEIWQIAPPDA